MKIRVDDRHTYIPGSIIIFIVVSLLVGILGPNDEFAPLIEMFIGDFIAIMAGALAVSLRIFKVPIKKTNFLYNFIATVNVLYAFLGIILMKVGVDYWIAVLFFLNLFIALFIYYDVFKRSAKT